MASVYSDTVIQVARRTLSREDDERALPEDYLEELARWLEIHPNDDYFLIDLYETPPTVTCLDCFQDVSLTPSPANKLGLRSFETHANNPEHVVRVRERAKEQRARSISVQCTSLTALIKDARHGLEDDSTSLRSRHSSAGASASLPNTPDTSFESLPDEDMAFKFDSNAAPWNNGSNVAAGKKRASGSSVDSSFGPLGQPDDEQGDRKRARITPQPEAWSDFDLDEDISMMEIPADFWEPVVPKEEQKPVVLASSKPRSKRPSAVLAALDDLMPGPSSRKLQAKVKPEPVEDIKHFPVAGSSRIVKAEPVYDNRHLLAPSAAAGPSRPVKPDPARDPRAMLGMLPAGPAAPAAGADPALDAYGAYIAKIPRPAVQPALNGPPGFPNIPRLAFDAAAGMAGLARGAVDAMQGFAFRLNADVGAPIPGLDYGGPEHEGELKEFFTRGMEDLAETEGVQDALAKLKLPSVGHKLPGMDMPLLPHQVLGVAWMNKLELSKHKGGILADDMGLGKTVQMIAAMCLNRPTDEDAEKSTLIIVPTSLLQQWRAEIENKTVDDTFRVFIHHGSTKLTKVKEIRKYDVVLTTYATLGADFEKLVKERGKKAADYIEDETRKKGALAKTKWWRVVLDEAQFIRNRLTVASINVASLDAVHRWSLTGTPVTNNLTDLYALIRFGKLRPWNDFEDFNAHVGKVQQREPRLAGDRAQALLKPIMLRRTKNSTVEGKPILELGPKTITVHKLEFSPREREIYDALEKRQQDKLKRILERGRMVKDYHFILVMLLRLRQAANHTQLITYAADEFGLNVNQATDDADNNNPEEELERATRLIGAPGVAKLKAKYLEQAKNELAKDDAEDNDAECAICYEPFAGNKRVTVCGHEFCAECIRDVLKQPLAPPVAGVAEDDGDRAEAAARPCPVCRSNLTEQLVFNSAAFEPSEEELEKLRQDDPDMDEEEAEFLRINAKRDVKGKGKAKSRTEVNGVDLAALDEGKNFKPSTKMLKMIEFLRQTQNNPVDGRVEKTILYSQWTSMIDLVQTLLRREGMKSLRYDGKMARGARDKAIAEFKSRNGANIIIISLKCGGVGLNLTEANRVISLDLAWNAATENQAFDRVHRLGQQRDVFIERLVVKDTIEDRIMDLQQKKQSLSDAALGEGTGQKLKRMGARELRQLFGLP